MATQQRREPTYMTQAREELHALGLSDAAIGRARWSRIADAQALATAHGAITPFFNTATSSRTANANGRAGCTLLQPGKIDDNTIFMPKFLGVSLLNARAITAPFLDDYDRLNTAGLIREVRINQESLGLRDILFQEAAEANGWGYNAHGAAGAIDGDGVTFNAHAARHPLGRRIYAFELPGLIFEGGDAIEADVTQYSGGPLSAATHVLRVTFWGIEAPYSLKDR